MTTGPWLPAAGPATVFVTVSEPVRKEYVSVMVAWALCPAPTVTVWPLPTVATATVLVSPLAVSVTTQLELAAIPAHICGYVPAAVCCAIVHSPRSVPLQTASIVIGPWLPAAGPAITLFTVNEP